MVLFIKNIMKVITDFLCAQHYCMVPVKYLSNPAENAVLALGEKGDFNKMISTLRELLAFLGG